MTQEMIIEGAFLAGFEPSAEGLQKDILFKEAEAYLYRLAF